MVHFVQNGFMRRALYYEIVLKENREIGLFYFILGFRKKTGIFQYASLYNNTMNNKRTNIKRIEFGSDKLMNELTLA